MAASISSCERTVRKYSYNANTGASISIGVSTIRELLGVVTAGSATSGIVVGSGDFTKAALSFALENDIELINDEALMRMVARVQNPSQTKQRSFKRAIPAPKLAEDPDDIEGGAITRPRI